MNLVDKYGVKAVVAMIISVCNTKAQKDEDKKSEKKEEKKEEKTKEPAADFSVES
jgi:ribosomal protein L12E/L44/L45/RPP1/RPP2